MYRIKHANRERLTLQGPIKKVLWKSISQMNHEITHFSVYKIRKVVVAGDSQDEIQVKSFMNILNYWLRWILFQRYFVNFA